MTILQEEKTYSSAELQETEEKHNNIQKLSILSKRKKTTNNWTSLESIKYNANTGVHGGG